MRNNKSKSDLIAENRALKLSRFSSGIVQVLNQLIMWGALVLIAHEVSEIFIAYAEKETAANITMLLFGNLEVSITLSLLVGICGFLYDAWQRKLRKDTVERLQGRNQELESKIDSKRSSSQLTARGETRKEDKV